MRAELTAVFIAILLKTLDSYRSADQASEPATTRRVSGWARAANNGDNGAISVYARALMNVVAGGGAFAARLKFVSVVDFWRVTVGHLLTADTRAGVVRAGARIHVT